MYKELRKQATIKVQTKMAFYVCAIVFSISAVVLLMLSFYFPYIAFWLLFPIPIFVMILAILYLFAFGPLSPRMTSADWREEEIEKEIVKLYRQKKLLPKPKDELTEVDILELKELEYLEDKWLGGQEYV